MDGKPRVAVHKFSSCDGCQLAILNLGEDLLKLAKQVELVHFAEAGPLAEEQPVDIAFVEGSISTERDIERIQAVRRHASYLVTMGACATSGGIQALRNLGDASGWKSALYASPDYIDSLATSTAISEHVKVDFQLWGCPITGKQVVAAIRALLFGVQPVPVTEKVCAECKRDQQVCVMVARGEPCMGPVTRGGCGALCPSFGRDCYGCYGPASSVNARSLGQRFEGIGLAPKEVADRFLFIHSASPPFEQEGLQQLAGKQQEE